MHPMGPPLNMGPMEPEYEEEFPNGQDPPDEDAQSKSQGYQHVDDATSTANSALMGGAQTRLKKNRMKKL